MNDAFEPVLEALFANLQAAATLSLSANASANSPVLSNVSNFEGLFVGLPVFGPGVARGASILALDPQAETLTLTAAVSAVGVEAPFSTGFMTTGRRLQHWTQVAAQPALFLRRIGTIDEYEHGSFFSRTTLECEVWIYSSAGKNPDAVPDVMLGCLDQMVRQSFAPDGDYGDPRYTVGGLAYWCRIEGKSDYSPGDQGGQAIARLPVRITLP
jgi:hypothetical protein